MEEPEKDTEKFKEINTEEILIMVYLPIFSATVGFWWGAFGLNRPETIAVWVYFLAWCVLWNRDVKRLKKAGIETDDWKHWRIVGIFLPVAYFWQRKKHTQDNSSYALINFCVCSGLTLLSKLLVFL